MWVSLKQASSIRGSVPNKNRIEPEQKKEGEKCGKRGRWRNGEGKKITNFEELKGSRDEEEQKDKVVQAVRDVRELYST